MFRSIQFETSHPCWLVKIGKAALLKENKGLINQWLQFHSFSLYMHLQDMLHSIPLYERTHNNGRKREFLYKKPALDKILHTVNFSCQSTWPPVSTVYRAIRSPLQESTDGVHVRCVFKIIRLKHQCFQQKGVPFLQQWDIHCAALYDRRLHFNGNVILLIVFSARSLNFRPLL